MDVDVEGIIQCIKQGDENGVQMQLQEFNKQVASHNPPYPSPHSFSCRLIPKTTYLLVLTPQYAQCFFFDAEERERRRVS